MPCICVYGSQLLCNAPIKRHIKPDRKTVMRNRSCTALTNCKRLGYQTVKTLFAQARTEDSFIFTHESGKMLQVCNTQHVRCDNDVLRGSVGISRVKGVFGCLLSALYFHLQFPILVFTLWGYCKLKKGKRWQLILVTDTSADLYSWLRHCWVIRNKPTSSAIYGLPEWRTASKNR